MDFRAAAMKGAHMKQLQEWWLVGAVMLAACTDSTAPPAAAKLAFTMQPSSATAGVAIDPGVTVAIQNEAGDLVPDAANVVTVAIEKNAGGGTMPGTVSVTAVNGVATFTNLRIDKAGTGYTLTATATGLTSATSSPFAIVPGPATRLVFAVQPSTTAGGAAITPPVQVAAQDSFGNLATGFVAVVTVALGNPASGTLSGTTGVAAIGGVATFADLSVAPVGTGYTLAAAAPRLPGASSVSFASVPPTGPLQITARTSGNASDPDGYDVCVDPIPDGHGGASCLTGGAIGVNGALSLSVVTGAHAVLLRGLAAGCAISGDNPRAVQVSVGPPNAASFAVTCSKPVLHITTTTTGVSLDPDGFTLCIDTDFDGGCSFHATIGVNDSVTAPVSSGAHTVTLDDVTPNCTVAGYNLRGVVAPDTADVSFVISCVAAGTVHVRWTTTGFDLPNGYRVSVCRDSTGTDCMSTFVPPNGESIFLGVIAGSHTVTLAQVPANCALSGASSLAVTVPTDATVDVTFAVSCVQGAAEQIAFSSSNGIAVMRQDGTRRQPVVPGRAPAWSPIGARLAYECGQDICAVDVDGTGLTQLTTDGARNQHPTWSPDGLKIAFGATHATGTDLYVMAANGSGSVRLAQGVGFVRSPAWSPDGTRIAFDCRVDIGNDDICVVNADGTGFIRLTNDPARDYGAAWKPDGSALGFATTRYGADEIVLMSPGGGSVTRIGAGLPGFAPTWSPDGTRLAFVRASPTSSFKIFVATTAGADGQYFADGDQPAWKPHP